ncbi:putative aldouronate transport system permease protein [Paenibacillus sp. yr247]|uniref:carbohydrate ABC transporter permease n=1 Tax=Paenibacillus sp. yr247 TaxID=1761880 RepID=UPI0008905A2E|nr:carbohydrate ABC transporter permease [Paenibacillus sp. yr247]SDO24504.1 putative aldouronate transport system permease protein [Paenibacillus sp. yr247]
MSFVQTKRLTVFDYINYSALTIISLISSFPILYLIIVSLTDKDVYVPFQFNIWPERWSLEAYTYLLSTPSFLAAYKNTIFITIVGTFLNLLFTFTMAYGLTEKQMPYRNIIMGMVILTLVFNPGIIPNYLLVKELGLLNSFGSLIWPVLTNAWSLIVVKGFLDSIPTELKESAKIDGSTDVGIFFRIILPLSMPAVAAFTLFFAIAHWNTYFNAILYLTDTNKWTLQVLVKTLVLDASSSMTGNSASSDQVLPQETVRIASVVLAMLPILLVYPFLQKHFAKGVMLGSVKG